MTQLVVFLLAIAIAFIAGTRSDYIMAALQNKSSPGDALDLRSVQALYRELKDNYDGTLNSNKLVDGAKHGLAESIGDPYTVYFTADEAKEFNNSLEGMFEGIGAELGKRNDVLTVMSIIDNSPAAKAGLRSNDVIVKVNEEESSKWSVEKAVSKIRGKKDTTVKLTIVRGDNSPQELSVVRDNVTDPSVKTEITADNIGIMRISRFSQSETTNLARKAAQEFKDRAVRGVVVDLRGNSGGYVTASQEIASLWMKDKVVVAEKSIDGSINNIQRTSGQTVLEGVPTVILVNEGSASASEILAGALHDNKVAKLVGLKTYGKGVMQKVIDLPDGGNLKVTIASWYTPNGKNISKEGIEPDVKVTMTDDDYVAGRDPQKDKALELLK